jgi:inosine/xanthosine triphosphate pyrophosphatase family protein
VEVAALAGQPGALARFIPDPMPLDRDRRTLLLQKLSPFPPPLQARLICVAALALPAGDSFLKRVCPGEIVPQEHGQHGFGYAASFLVAAPTQPRAQWSYHTTPHQPSAQGDRARYPYFQSPNDWISALRIGL